MCVRIPDQPSTFLPTPYKWRTTIHPSNLQALTHSKLHLSVSARAAVFAVVVGAAAHSVYKHTHVMRADKLVSTRWRWTAAIVRRCRAVAETRSGLWNTQLTGSETKMPFAFTQWMDWWVSRQVHDYLRHVMRLEWTHAYTYIHSKANGGMLCIIIIIIVSWGDGGWEVCSVGRIWAQSRRRQFKHDIRWLNISASHHFICTPYSSLRNSQLVYAIVFASDGIYIKNDFKPLEV